MSHGVLLAIEGIASAGPVVRTAVSYADRLGLPLTVLHVLSEDELQAHRDSVREGAPLESGYLDVVLTESRGRIASAVAKHLDDAAAEVEVRVLPGEPDEVILDELRSGYDLGVIGIRSRSRVSKLVFGSTAQSVLLLAPCPILAVPLPD